MRTHGHDHVRVRGRGVHGMAVSQGSCACANGMVVLQGSCARANACADAHGRVDLANLRALTLHAVAHLVDLFFDAPLVLLQPRLNHGVRKTHERVAQAHPVLPRSGVSTSTGLLTTQRGERFAVAVSPPVEVQKRLPVFDHLLAESLALVGRAQGRAGADSPVCARPS